MTLSHEAYGKTVTISVDRDDLTMEEMVRLFAELLLAAGFAPETVHEWLDAQE